MTRPRLYLPEMLTYARPAGTESEREFIRRYIDPAHPGMTHDDRGNRYVAVPHADGSTPHILWSCHTDTVHNKPGRYPVEVDQGGILSVAYGCESFGCLGADCTTGVYIMLRLLEAGVPGLYVFHRAEEIGCIGSHWIARQEPSRGFLAGIEIAIAFDRRGKDSVVTYQCGMRTASDRFANALAAILGGEYMPDDGGVFTDTESYADLVPECTNVSVGYEMAHTAREHQDMHFPDAVAESLIAASLSGELDLLPVVRDPAVPDHLYARWAGSIEGWGKAADGPIWARCEMCDEWDEMKDGRTVCKDCDPTFVDGGWGIGFCAFCDGDLWPSDDGYEIFGEPVCRACYGDTDPVSLLPDPDTERATCDR